MKDRCYWQVGVLIIVTHTTHLTSTTSLFTLQHCLIPDLSRHPPSGSAKMMCEVMPTISEDTALSQRGSQSSSSDPDSHFEQLMVNMLDERDRLLDTLRETQESLGLAQQHLQDVIYDRDSLQRQLSSALPQVRHRYFALDGFYVWLYWPIYSVNINSKDVQKCYNWSKFAVVD